MEGDSGRNEGFSSGKLVPNHVGKHTIRLGDMPSILVTESEGVDWQIDGAVVGSCLCCAAGDLYFGKRGDYQKEKMITQSV